MKRDQAMVGEHETEMIGIEAVKRLTHNIYWKKIKKMKMLYVFLLLPLVFLFFFSYLPIYGVLIAFKHYRFGEGILGSPWNNFAHFQSIYNDFFFHRAFWNTLRINAANILIIFPLPIIFALLLNELRANVFKRVVQSISYLPHFLSWVVIGGFVYHILSPQIGFLNYILSLFGVEPIYFMTISSLFIPIVIASGAWQTVGWSSIIYLAAISAVDPSLYESAEIDGANRFHKAVFITLPSIIPSITILFILGLSGILNGNFDQIFNLYNPLVMNVADVIDTYVYRKGLLESRFDYAAAVGLFQSVVGIIFIYSANKIIKKFTEYGIW